VNKPRDLSGKNLAGLQRRKERAMRRSRKRKRTVVRNRTSEREILSDSESAEQAARRMELAWLRERDIREAGYRESEPPGAHAL